MATRIWLGRAVNIKQVDTVTIANTWAQNDTITLTINGKDIVVTIGTLVTTAQVATTLQEAFENATLTDTSASVSPATGKTTIGEFSQITATVSGSVVTFTADTAGRPFTMSVVEVTAGDGTSAEATATVATGQNHWDNTDNWTGDTVPVDGDTVIFNQGDVDLKYALGTSMQPAVLTITQGYTGLIGLPKVNLDNSALPYDEYQTAYLTLADDVGTSTLAIDIGRGSGQGSGLIKIDAADSGNITMNVYGSGSRAESQTPALLFLGSDVDTILNVLKGDVGVAYYSEETAHLAELRVLHLDDPAGDATVVCGSGLDIANATIEQTGGTLTIDSATGSGTIVQTEGELTILSGAHASIDTTGGTVYYQSSGTLTTGRVSQTGRLDFSRDNQSRTVTNTERHKGGSILDPFKTVTWTNGIDLYRSGLSDEEGIIDIGTHVTISMSAV